MLRYVENGCMMKIRFFFTVIFSLNFFFSSFFKFLGFFSSICFFTFFPLASIFFFPSLFFGGFFSGCKTNLAFELWLYSYAKKFLYWVLLFFSSASISIGIKLVYRGFFFFRIFIVDIPLFFPQLHHPKKFEFTYLII